MDFIYEYEFADGLLMQVLSILSESSVLALERVHGKGKLKRIRKCYIDMLSLEEDA